MDQQRPKVKPFLRWAGSKKQLLPVLQSYWKEHHKRYVEPFAGSACFFFSIQPSSAILADINKELIDTFRCVKKRPKALFEKLSTLKNEKSEYYRIRAICPNSLTEVERASRFIYLNRYCFNGLYRTNLKGKFNVPYGGHKTGRLPNLAELKRISKALSKTLLFNCDFEQVLLKVEEGDFVYLDPPYSISERRVFNEYSEAIFSKDDIERLKNCLDRLTSEGIEFLVSYADSEEAQYLHEGYDVEYSTVRRNIAGFVKNRRSDRECLISNKRFV